MVKFKFYKSCQSQKKFDMTGEEDMTNKFAVSILLCHQLSDVELIMVFPQF